MKKPLTMPEEVQPRNVTRADRGLDWKLMAFRLSSEEKPPDTRTAMRSGPASTVPLGATAFCACSALTREDPDVGRIALRPSRRSHQGMKLPLPAIAAFHV